MHYEIMHIRSGELTGHFDSFKEAAREAERLCALNNRQDHFAVIKIEQVWITSYLDEAINNK